MLTEKGIKQTWLATAQLWINYKFFKLSIQYRYKPRHEIIYDIISILVINPEGLLSHPKSANNG